MEEDSMSTNVDNDSNSSRKKVKAPKSTGKPYTRKNASKKIVKPSRRYLCKICADRKYIDRTFSVTGCRRRHRYCTECIAKYIETELQNRPAENEGNEPSFKCPGLHCKGSLQLHTCREILPDNVVAMWEDALCESTIAPSEKFYCPFKDCSAMMVNNGEEAIRESECPACHRLFCAQCKVPWHSDLGCEDFTRLNAEKDQDEMVYELAKKEKWQRCPCCKFLVEKSQGCLHMRCRCKHEFCYACGATWNATHGSTCQRRAPEQI